MEKALIASDLHVHFYKQFNENGRRMQSGIAFLNYLFKLADANGIKYILFTGDLHNNMQIIATKVVKALAACFQANFAAYPDVKFICISGNHDFADKNLIDAPGDSAMDSLAAVFPRFILLDQIPTGYTTANGHMIHGVPYYDHAEHFRIALSQAEKGVYLEDKNHFLLMHQSVDSGLPIDDDIMCTDTLFDPFTMVFNGHIHHNKNVADFFINVGAPMHRDAGDVGHRRGFWIVDLDDPIDTISFMDITDKYPQFIHKFVGEPLSDWESQQYVIWVQNPKMENSKDQEITEKFNTSLAPKAILENYCKEVLSKDEFKDKLAYGLTLLS